MKPLPLLSLLATVAAFAVAADVGAVVGFGPLAALTRATRSAGDAASAQGFALERGHAHEPATPSDRFPGLVHRPCADPADTHRGACNDYAGARSTARLYVDLRAHLVSPALAAAPGATWTGPSFAPGAYGFHAAVGRWKDLAHPIEESVYAPEPALWQRPECRAHPVLGLDQALCTYTVPPDGWVGNVVATTHQYRWEGHAPETCRMHGVQERFEYAVCHPYRDGWGADGHDFRPGGSAGEFTDGCAAVDRSLPPVVRLLTGSGSFAAPTFVWRDRGGIAGGFLDDWTGRRTPLELRATCEEGTLRTLDVLLLPQGNAGMALTTELTLADARSGEGLADVDAYPPLV